MSEVRSNGTLIIVVLKARNLPNRRKLDKQNPYCIARIANIVDRTSAITRGGQTPEWNHESRFQITSNINPILKLSVLDETKKSPVLIGDTEIDCSPVFSASSDEGYDKWHSLQYAGRSAGEIYVEMTFYPTEPKEPYRKKGLVTLHRNPIRPLPSRPGEDTESGDDQGYDQAYSVLTGKSSWNKNWVQDFNSSAGSNSSHGSHGSHGSSSSSHSTAPSSIQSSRLHPLNHSYYLSSSGDILQDSLTKKIIRENPDKFEQLIARNPQLLSSVAHTESSAGSARNLDEMNASFDDLEKEVQIDWFQNNLGVPKHKFASTETSSKHTEQFDPFKISSVLPKLPEFDSSKSELLASAPPIPPHKSLLKSQSAFNPFPKRRAPPGFEVSEASFA